jgi:nickel superoxide dismutase
MRHVSTFACLAIACLCLAASRADAHCQLPCGVYDDEMRFSMMGEHVTTIAKCMAVITDEKSATNQVVRATIV